MPDETPTPYEQAQRALDAWHATHPDADWYDMERAVEQQIDRLRSALLAAQTGGRYMDERPACPHCGTTMVARTRKQRRVMTKGDEPLDFERTYVVCPSCREGLFPLEGRLGLLSCAYSPVIVEAMVRLGARLPFAVVAEEIALLFSVSFSAETVRRLTEEAGAVLAGIEQRELKRLEHDGPEELAGPAVQQVSADGCMLSLTTGRWMEVRTIASGTVTQREDGELSTQEMTCFSRHWSADSSIRQAILPTHERGRGRQGP